MDDLWIAVHANGSSGSGICAGCGVIRSDVQVREQWDTDKREQPDMRLCDPCYSDYLREMDEADRDSVYE